MASYTVTTAKHATLAASTADTVTFGADRDRVEIVNRGTSELYCTFDGTAPTVGGDDCDVVLAGAALQVDVPTTGNTAVKLISAGSTPYSVRGL